MIDLKKPLEGVPGLLLLAALVFFGAALGVVAALGFKWVKLEPDMANFLGGVVGAFLGSSLAVLEPSTFNEGMQEIGSMPHLMRCYPG